jgi:hypothetical protein
VTVLVDVVVLFALITDVTVCQVVVEYVAVARAEIVVVTRRVDVYGTVIVLIIEVIVVNRLFWRFSRECCGGGN